MDVRSLVYRYTLRESSHLQAALHFNVECSK